MEFGLWGLKFVFGRHLIFLFQNVWYYFGRFLNEIWSFHNWPTFNHLKTGYVQFFYSALYQNKLNWSGFKFGLILNTSNFEYLQVVNIKFMLHIICILSVKLPIPRAECIFVQLFFLSKALWHVNCLWYSLNKCQLYHVKIDHLLSTWLLFAVSR